MGRNFTSLLRIANIHDNLDELNHLRSAGLNALINALNSVLPAKLLPKFISLTNNILSIQGNLINISEIPEIVIIGGGKASKGMCLSLLEIIEGKIPINVMINLPYNQNPKFDSSFINSKTQIEFNFASHPIPDESGISGVRKMLDMIKNSSPKSLIFFLISGGGSALLPFPCPSISLQDLKLINQLLLDSGASISEINCIRKHLSKIKGGRLTKFFYPRRAFSFILSDVVGNDLQVIASGPTVPDDSTFDDAVFICRKYNLWERIPKSIQIHIIKGKQGLISETLKTGSIFFDSITNIIIGSAEIASSIALQSLISKNFSTNIISKSLQGEASDFGKTVNALILKNLDKNLPKALIGTGEFTVSLNGNGIGGRNQEMLLAFIIDVMKNPTILNINLEFVVISFAFDGIEGNSPAAGAIIDSEMIRNIIYNQIDPINYLKNNDSFHFFQKLGANLVTGYTGTNVNDMIIILFDKRN